MKVRAYLKPEAVVMGWLQKLVCLLKPMGMIKRDGSGYFVEIPVAAMGKNTVVDPWVSNHVQFFTMVETYRAGCYYFRESGIYEKDTASAEFAIIGESCCFRGSARTIEDLLGLYFSLRAGEIEPTQKYNVWQVGVPPPMSFLPTEGGDVGDHSDQSDT